MDRAAHGGGSWDKSGEGSLQGKTRVYAAMRTPVRALTVVMGDRKHHAVLVFLEEGVGAAELATGSRVHDGVKSK